MAPRPYQCLFGRFGGLKGRPNEDSPIGDTPGLNSGLKAALLLNLAPGVSGVSDRGSACEERVPAKNRTDIPRDRTRSLLGTRPDLDQSRNLEKT